MSIRKVIQHLDFFPHLWDSGNWEKLQGQKPPHIYLKPIPPSFRGEKKKAKGLHFDLSMGFLSLLLICFSSENKPFFLQKGTWRLGNKRWNHLRCKGIAGISQQSLTIYTRKIGQVGWHYHMATILLHMHAGRQIPLHLGSTSIIPSLRHERGGRGGRKKHFTSSSAFCLLKPFADASLTCLDLILFL